MAESKYLDQGGVSHLWSKIKSFFIDNYLLNTYGTGINGNNLDLGGNGKPYIQIGPSRLVISNNNSNLKVIDLLDEKIVLRCNERPALRIENSDVVAKNSDVEILDKSVINAKNARIFLDVTENFFRIYEDRGIALLYKILGATNIVNSTNKILRICLVGGSTVSSRDLGVGGTIKIQDGIVTIAFWSAES